MSISVNGQSCVPPGFRFHPTEEELLNYYLRKKVASQEIDLDVIRDVDLNKLEPWDIQEKCKIGSGPQNDWYFFSHKDKKYPTGTRTNRATAAGFWKATGRDKAIYNAVKRIGMRKTLVFYKGRAPHGQKSDWIMHEYRLDDPSGVGRQPGGRLGGVQGVQEEAPPQGVIGRWRRRRRTKRRQGSGGEPRPAVLLQRRRARPDPAVHGQVVQAGARAAPLAAAQRRRRRGEGGEVPPANRDRAGPARVHEAAPAGESVVGRPDDAAAARLGSRRRGGGHRRRRRPPPPRRRERDHGLGHDGPAGGVAPQRAGARRRGPGGGPPLLRRRRRRRRRARLLHRRHHEAARRRRRRGRPVELHPDVVGSGHVDGAPEPRVTVAVWFRPSSAYYVRKAP
nr:uncharacterized protein LOC117859708 isoform X1 [Setaria viridis]